MAFNIIEIEKKNKFYDPLNVSNCRTATTMIFAFNFGCP